MYQTFLFSCALFVLCYAQTRPVIPESFTAMTHFEVHRGREAEFGKGYWCSDATGMREVRNDTLDDRQTKGYFYTLDLFRERLEYHIRPDEGKEECNNEPLRGDYVPPFEWVKTAKFNGSEEVEHRTLDVWFTRVATSEYALAVDKEAPNVPVAFLERHQGESFAVTFETFTPGTPAASYFEVPRNCRTPPAI